MMKILKNITIILYLKFKGPKITELTDEQKKDYGEIYCIVNANNNCRYIGQTRCMHKIRGKFVYYGFRKRFEQHLKNCKVREHDCPKLYRDMKKNSQVFYVYLLERCHRYDINKRERFYIRNFKSRRRGYNTTAGGQNKRYRRYNRYKK